MTEKPEYSVPTLEDIRAREPNGLSVASTFSGCGGSSLGYRMAGFRVLYALEFVEAARSCYRLNCSPDTFIDSRDIRDLTGGELLEAANVEAGELDVLDGSPPCSSFSTAGSRESGWGQVKSYSDREQRTDDLFFEFARIVDEVRPKTFVAENVSGLVKGKAKGYFLEILRLLKGLGYRVEAKVLDASWLGVPQARQRLFFVGVRDDIDAAPAFPKPLPYRYLLRDALPYLRTGKGAGPEWGVEPETDLSRYATGRQWRRLRPGEQSDRYFQLVRAHPDYPVGTITATASQPGSASVTHPFECRKFAIAELKRLCSFPDDFQLAGTYQENGERLGRSVPPVMMSYLAAALRDKVLSQ